MRCQSLLGQRVELARGRVGFGAYLLLLHGGILLLSAGWLLARHHGWGGAWRRRLPGGGR